MKSVEGNVEFKSVQICERKIPLHDLRLALIKKHESYIRLLPDTEICGLRKDDITAHMTIIHHQPAPNASLEELQDTLSTL